MTIVKSPFSDVTSDVFIEVHSVTMPAGGPDDLTFDRSYRTAPAVFISPSTTHTAAVTARTTSGCTLDTGSGSSIVLDVIVIGR